MTRKAIRGLLVTATIASSCGGGPGGATTFVGFWEPTGGGLTALCPVTNLAVPATEPVAFIEDSGGLFGTRGNCTAAFTIMGGTATAIDLSPCTETVGNQTIEYDFSAWTFSLSGVETIRGGAIRTNSTGSDICNNLSGMSTYRRTGP